MAVESVLVRHCRILANIDAIEGAANGPRPQDMEALGAKRWAFTRDLLLHFEKMEAQIYAPMMTDRRDYAVERAAVARAQTASLVADFKAHVDRWKGLPSAEIWPEYAPAVARLMARVRDRLDTEALEIVPLLPVEPQDERARRCGTSYAAEAWRVRSAIYNGDHSPLA